MPKIRRPLAGLLAALAIALVPATGVLRAQTRHAEAADGRSAVVVPAMPDDLVGELLLLADDACDVRYVPGSLDRAAHVEEWLRALALGGGRRTGSGSRLVAVVLDRDSWKQARLACVYGLPCVAGERVLALPAAGDAATVTFWRDALGALPTLEGNPLMGTADEAASLWPADQVGASMAGRALLAAAGVRGDEPWVLDLLGHALALDAARQAHFEAAFSGFWHALVERPLPAGGDALAAELHHQARLFTAAEALIAREHKLPMRALRKMQERGGGVIRAADLRAAWPDALQRVDGGAAATPRR